MQRYDDLSCRMNTFDECSSTDDITGYHPVGANETSSQTIWDSLSDICKKSIRSKFLIDKKNISMDVDAYSFVISADKMTSDKKRTLREFLLSFGSTSFGRCSFPTWNTGSKSKDSLFGCAGNESQHLPYILQGNEMLVIDVPVKIGLHISCQTSLIEYLKAKGFYYLPSSVKSGVCFNPYAAANKPPYDVLVDAIIESCEVSSQVAGNMNLTNIIHIADMGFRSPLTNNYEAISDLFSKCTKMEKAGLTVELTQFDIGFVFPVPQDHLLQATIQVNEVNDKDSLFQKSRTTVYPLHKLPILKEEKLKNKDLRGTFEIKKTDWAEGRNVIFDDDSYNSGIHLFASSNANDNVRDYISIHSSTLHSVKGYSTVAHSLMQKRSKYPLNDRAMYGIGYKKIQYIQTLLANAKLSLNETFHAVKTHGIGFRIEISIRPHFSDPIRYSRHGNDLLLIATLAIQELCGSKFTMRLTTFPTRSVQTEAMKLLSEVTSMVHSRKDICFNQVYGDEKVIEWLRSHLTLLLITIGICPEYGIKYINQWLMDAERFDPHNKVIVPYPRSGNDSLALIQHRMIKSFERHLEYLRFSKSAVENLRMFLVKAPNVDPISCLTSLSLSSKHLLVNTLWTDIIPYLSSFLSQDKNKVKMYGNEMDHIEQNNSEMEYEELLELLETPIFKQDQVLDDLMEKAPMPVHPLAIAIRSLIKLSLLWSPSRQGFNQILLHYIKGCHENESLGYDEIRDQKTSCLIHDCLKGRILTRDDLRHICLQLIPSCATRNQPIFSYQRMLCKHYQFPTSDIGCIVSGNIVSRKKRNSLINQALTQDFSVSIFQDNQKVIFHRISENTTVEVMLLNKILRIGYDVQRSTTFHHHNLYCLLAEILHSKSDTRLRQLLFDRMTRLKKSLQEIFLTSDGITSKFFKGIHTLKDLEYQHQFRLLKVEDTIPNLVLSARYEPEIVFSLASYIYQKNIIFFDMSTNKTLVFMYWKSRSIKYQTEGCNWLPTIKSVIICRDDHKIFKCQNLMESESTIPMMNTQVSELFSLSPISGRLSAEIRLNQLSKRKRVSSGHHFYSALSKLLNELDERYLENSDHGVWESDCLGLKSFLLELSRSGLNQNQLFQQSLSTHCELFSLPLRLQANCLLQNASDQITHKLLCPLVCLKYHNLIFGVFDFNHRKKETYFYAHNPCSNMVEMKKYPKFVRLIDRSQTLYLYSCASRSEYFVPEDVRVSNLETNWRWDVSLTGKYSHISLKGMEKCLEHLKVTCDAQIIMNHEELEDFNWRPEYPSVVIKTSEFTDQSMKISFLSHSNIPLIALILIFPTSSELEEWDVCIVHHPCQDKESALRHLLMFLENSPRPGRYNPTCVEGRIVEHCESGFYMFLYAYLAFHSKFLKNFLISMRAVNRESDIKWKCQQWLQATMRTESRVNLPWLTQILWNTSPTNDSNEMGDACHANVNHNSKKIQRSSNRNPEISSMGVKGNKKRASLTQNVHHMQTPPSKITNVTNTNVSSNVPIFFGLKNPGNFCYMNVIIQCLHGLKCVRDHFSKINFQNDMNFSMALKRLFSQMKSRKGDISVMEFKNTIVLTPLFKEFDNNHQQDAHHFMIKVLQSISHDILSSHNDLISLWFRSTLLSRVQCQTCDSSSTNLGDHSTSIEIEIVGDKLQECLANFFGYEELDSSWICGNCNKECSASKYFLLQERPILIIALKRFSDTYEKNTRNVRFPLENLRIPNMVNENYEASDGTIYKLFAVINHLGMSSDSGHYTLFMNVHDNWLKFDDENVVQIRKERVNSSNAYILVYVVNTKFKELAS